MLALRIISGMAKQIAIRVAYIKHKCPAHCVAQKRVALREFAELVLGTISILIAGKLKDGTSLHECSAVEKEFVKKLGLIRRDINAMLRSVQCDLDD
ncbi:hypothetical protein HMPREF9543_01079 [Escherichia coli MS 146-1]|uniref:hypothetical protein n=1 Tax=Escherichia coli TaxID=562 RepID=UPI0001DD25E5|nr:hypothetical protein [Escherichia coli]EFA9349930.1 hypothetical protein [Escherichia coli]EFK92041.1 hypothetical protein HMPREF9543_01079 [Escherichia coli MS 146-1]EIY7171825.1 hypothetical protein [Escherichia coli]